MIPQLIFQKLHGIATYEGQNDDKNGSSKQYSSIIVSRLNNSVSNMSSHPMVSVPDALHIVLKVTAQNLMLRQGNGYYASAEESTRRVVEEVRINVNDPIETSRLLLGRRLAQDIVMPEPGYPPYRASIMDGYAIAGAAAVGNDDVDGYTHRIVGKILTGNYSSSKDVGNDNIDYDAKQQQSTSENKDDDNVALLSSFVTTLNDLPDAYYVTTGAVVPEHCTVVVPVEECVVSSDDRLLRISNFDSKTTWIRPVGCDIPAKTLVLEKGSIIDAVDVGLITQTFGTDDRDNDKDLTVSVYARPRIGVLSTGNEILQKSLVAKDGAAATNNNNNIKTYGCIPDANRPLLLGLLQTWSQSGILCETIDLGVARDDDAKALANVFINAIQNLHCDVIISTGGISVGESDILERVLIQELHGALHFGRLHMKPGKPTTLITIPTCQIKSNNTNSRHSCMVFALPGNPVSAAVCAHLLVKPCIDLLYNGPYDIADNNPDVYGTNVQEVMKRIALNARVHPECTADLTHNIMLDIERPEYCRVTLQQSNNNNNNSSSNTESDEMYHATFTGVQRSSRLLSMRNAQALLVLPQATEQKKIAHAGEKYTALWIVPPPPSISTPIARKAVHLSTCSHFSRPSLKVGIVRVESRSSNTTDVQMLDERIIHALSGKSSGQAHLVFSRVFTGSFDDLYDFVVSNNDNHNNEQKDIDLYVVVTPLLRGSFAHHVQCAQALKSRLSKIADHVALQARKGAAIETPTSALAEVVVGFAELQRALVILVPQQGISGALSNVRGVLKHALEVARS